MIKMELIPITEYLDGRNTTVAWNLALQKCLSERALGVYFPAGTYHFYRQGCVEKYCFFSNNDEGVKNIVFYLENLDEFVLAGENAKFIFHGRLSPLVARNCRNLTIKGFSIDFEESFVSNSEIVRVGDLYTDLQIEGKHWLENSRLRFVDDVYDNLSNRLLLIPFNRERMEPHATARPVIYENQGLSSPQNGIIRLSGQLGKPGDCFAIKHQERLCPGIVIDRCRNFELENVTIYHCAGMGFLGQCSENISLHKLAVTPSPYNKRWISASDDALHLSDCRGILSIDHCLLSNTLDDGINVHGIYRRLRKREVGTRFLFLESGHFQQLGLQVARPGDVLEFIKNDTLKPYHTAKVKMVNPLTKQITQVEFETELPAEFQDGDGVRVLEVAAAKLIVRNCVIIGVCPRGILFSGVHRAIIENNRIHSAGAGLYLSGDANFWFETGPLQEVLIQGNSFDHCNFMPAATGCAPISIEPELPRLEKDFYYHHNIKIINNVFYTNSLNAIHGKSIDGLTFTGNTFVEDHNYKNYFMECEQLQCHHCRNLEVGDNLIKRAITEER